MAGDPRTVYSAGCATDSGRWTERIKAESKEGREILEQGGLQARREVLLEATREALAAGDETTLRLVLNDQHAADLAKLLRALEEESGRRCMGLLAEGLSAKVMSELDAVTAAR